MDTWKLAPIQRSLDHLHGCPYGQHFLCRFVIDLDVEGIFGVQDNIHQVGGVDVEVLQQVCFRRNGCQLGFGRSLARISSWDMVFN